MHLLHDSNIPEYVELAQMIVGYWMALMTLFTLIESFHVDMTEPQVFILAQPFQAAEGYYDHAVFVHLLDQMTRLQEKGTMLCHVSSKPLEALIKITKRFYRMIPGGGRVPMSGAHLLAVKVYKKVFAFTRAQCFKGLRKMCKRVHRKVQRRTLYYPAKHNASTLSLPLSLFVERLRI